jgi:hypothetical protein
MHPPPMSVTHKTSLQNITSMKNSLDKFLEVNSINKIKNGVDNGMILN